MTRLSPTAQGIVLMLAAIALFSTMDAVAKLLIERTPVMQVVWARYAGQMAVVAVILAPRLPVLIRTRNIWLQLLRSAFLFAATFSFFTSLSYMQIASATAVMNIHPVILTLGAALILREKLGPRRIFGIAMALLGALIIIRPGADVFQPWALLPLVAGLFYAAYSLATRFLGRNEPILTSFLYTALLGTLAATVLVVPVWQTPSATDWLIYLGLGIAGAAGQFCFRLFVWGDPDGEETAAQSAGLGLGQVDVQVWRVGKKGAILAGFGHVQPQQCVVVAVKNRRKSGSSHRKCSSASKSGKCQSQQTSVQY